jgi:nucleoside 2-deoxyribosyltransferase
LPNQAGRDFLPKKLKCFISFSANEKIKPLAELLLQRNILVEDAFSLPDNSYPIYDAISERIRQADFIIVLLSLEHPNSNVFYELGFAKALDKPIFLIINDSGVIPPELSELVYVRASPKDINVISFTLDKFLNNLNRGTLRTLLKQKDFHKNIEITNIYSEKHTHLPSSVPQNEVMAIERITELLSRQKIIFETGVAFGSKIADISLWVDSLESNLGNPILMEIKIGHLTEKSLKLAEDQLIKLIQNTNARIGLLIYGDKDNRHFASSKLLSPLIIRFEYRDFISKLSKCPLDLIILSERDRMAHEGDE